MRSPNQWLDPAHGTFYQWPVNHNEEQPIGKSRQMADGAPTSNIGLIPQQGAATPLIRTLKGNMFDDAQHAANLHYWQLCEGQSIYFVEFNADTYEVIITDYEANKKRVARNPRFPAKTYIWEYTVTMRVLRALSGPWAGVTP